MHPQDTDDEKIPWMQQLLDNPFLLLFLGVMIPMIVYSLWGRDRHPDRATCQVATHTTRGPLP